ncbi:LAFA_0F08460g1_1 [Lachancea sp. 'fantastica']|nr:LAFA_0F08460g1_1 [Lachancea sp. 'fantastica']
MDLCRELFINTSQGHGNSGRKLTILPNGVLPKNSPPFSKIDDENGLEIFCSKYTYLQIFVEARNHLQSCGANTLSNDEETYLATLGLLLITPEDRTVLNLHEELLLRRLKTQLGDRWAVTEESKLLFECELSAIMLLLTSSSNRVNKSSSLWLLFKKLYTLKREVFVNSKINCCQLFMSSAERHISNFYCWNTLRWVYDLEGPAAQTELFEAVWNFSKRHPKDSSAWWALGHILLRLPGPASDSIQSYNALRARFHLTNRFTQALNSERHFGKEPGANVALYFSKIMAYIEVGEVRDWPPFGCLVRLSQHMSSEEHYHSLRTWRNEIDAFEENYFEINQKSVASAIYKNNRGLLIQRSVESLLLRKTSLSKIDIVSLRNTKKVDSKNKKN